MPLLAGLGPLGVPELLIIAFIIVLIFGVGRLPEVGNALGKGIREFRKATKDDADASPPPDTPVAVGAAPGGTMNASATQPSASSTAAPQPPVTAAPSPAPVSQPAAPAPAAPPAAASSDTRFCSECGAKNARSAKFCAECGHSMNAIAR